MTPVRWGEKTLKVGHRSIGNLGQGCGKGCLITLDPGPDRIPPQAHHPGAPWQVLPYERQLQVKEEQVADALRRLGHLDDFTLEPIVPAEQTWRYRNKVEYSFGAEESGRLVGPLSYDPFGVPLGHELLVPAIFRGRFWFPNLRLFSSSS